MPDTADGGNVPEQKEGDPPVQPEPNAAGDHKKPAETGKSNSAKEENSATTNLEKDIRTGERWLIGIGIASVVINTAIALIYWGQLVQMRKATKAAADSANASLSTAITAIQQMKAAEEANWLNRANVLSSERQSATTLKTGIDQFHADQRAWIGLIAIDGLNYRDASNKPVYMKAGDMTHLGADLTNSGKTIAKRVKSCVNTILVPRGSAFIPKDADCKLTFGSAPVVMPGMKVTIWTSDSEMMKGTENRIASIQSGDVQLYFFGHVEYYDVSGAVHFFKFCTAMSRDLNIFVAVGPYNDAN